MRILALSLIGILLISLDSYSFAQMNQDNEFTLRTNASNYDEGDTIVISGNVSLVIEDAPIKIQIWKDGVIINLGQTKSDQDGNYSHTIIAEGQIWTQGTYVVRALYGEGMAETTFTFKNFESLEEPEPQDQIDPPDISEPSLAENILDKGSEITYDIVEKGTEIGQSAIEKLAETKQTFDQKNLEAKEIVEQKGSEAIQEVGEIILEDDQMIYVGIGVIILIIIIAGIALATRKKSEPEDL